MTDELAKEPELDLTAEATAADAGLVYGTAPLKTPNITPAQVVGIIPLIAEFCHSFGIFDLSQAQQDSLSKLVLAGIALFGADAIVRVGRAIGNRLT